jgi:hypothetical protein
MALEFSRIVITTPLVSLEDAKVHLRITDTAHDADIQQKLTSAQDRIIAFLGAAADAAWDATTVPTPVAHAILELTTDFFENRGDGTPSGMADQEVWASIERLLSMYRDPVIS